MSVFNYKSSRGFTIVELLIVIVVIAILATITVVAYRGVTQNARNTTRLDAVGQMQQVIQLALTRNTPKQLWNAMDVDSNGWHRACFGKGYKDINGDGVGDCAWYGSYPHVSSVSAFDAFVTKLAEIPDMSGYPQTKAANGSVVAGPYFGSAWVDSADKLVIEYTLEGEGQDCKFSPLVYKIGGSTLSMTPNGDPKYTYSGGGVTECAIVMVAEPKFYQ